MLQFKYVSLQRDKKVLFTDASFALNTRQRVGLVGANGSGKSSLFSLILKEMEPDAGDIHYQCEQSQISHLAQSTPALEITAIDYVLDGDKELRLLEQKLASCTDPLEMGDLYQKMQDLDGYTATSRAASLLHGLGFKSNEFDKMVKDFSGGWRMRLNLAKCLMSPAKLLLLDEPTNHLDLEAIVWLEKYLSKYQGTILLISHDRDLLDNVCNRIIHLEHKALSIYSGNYSDFERMRAEKLRLELATHEKQMQRIKHLQSFVDRFKAKASKAKQAQSRIKAIDKIEVMALAQIDAPFCFEFAESQLTASPMMGLEKADIGYLDNLILENVDFNIKPGDRIGLLGKNGTGKSTFIKSLLEVLPLQKGELFKAKSKLNIGYYAQHQLEQLDSDASPYLHIQRLSPDASEKKIRSFLGGFAFIGDMALDTIVNFSGGEKARLALACIVWQRPNLLLLDEPTNHLDLDMRAALEIALQNYSGSLIIISHDRHLLETVVDEFYLIHNKALQPFDGDLSDYYTWLKEQTKKAAAKPAKIVKKPKSNTSKSKSASKTDLNRLKKLDSLISSTSANILVIEEKLSDNAIYEDKERLDKLLKEKAQLDDKLEIYEAEWMTLSEQLEQ